MNFRSPPSLGRNARLDNVTFYAVGVVLLVLVTWGFLDVFPAAAFIPWALGVPMFREARLYQRVRRRAALNEPPRFGTTPRAVTVGGGLLVLFWLIVSRLADFHSLDKL